jgi:MSHA pilin protein MshD
MTRLRQGGFTLIEMIVFIVVVGVGLAGILSVMNISVKSSADPLTRKQLIDIADAMLGEILLRPYSAPSAGVLPRATWTAGQYNNYTSAGGITDVSGNVLPGLANYKVTVTVAYVTAADNAQLFALPVAVRPLKVTVTSTDPNARTLTLTGYRASY